MKCENCGTENLEGASKCKNCKQSLILNQNKDVEEIINKEEIVNHDNQQLTTNNANVTYCPNCGTKITGGFSFCPNCGKSMKSPEQVTTTIDDGKAKYYIIVWLIFVFLGEVMPRLSGNGRGFGNATFLCNIGALITIIIAKIKYPKNKFFAFIFWATICTWILMALSFLLLLATCYRCTSDGPPVA